MQTKKLAVGTIFGKIKPEHYAGETPLPLVRFGGMCVGITLVPVAQTPDRPAVAFKGDLVGINLETGEEHRANTMYLPDIAGSWLQAQLARPGTKGVEFLFDITVEKNPDADAVAKGASVYVFGVDHVIKTAPIDPIARLLAEGAKVRPMIPRSAAQKAQGEAGAPASSPAPAPAAAAAPAPAPTPAPATPAPTPAPKGKK